MREGVAFAALDLAGIVSDSYNIGVRQRRPAWLLARRDGPARIESGID